MLPPDPRLAALRLCELRREAEGERLASLAATHRGARTSALARLALQLASRGRSVVGRPRRSVAPIRSYPVIGQAVGPRPDQKGCR